MLPPVSFNDRQIADTIGWNEQSAGRIRKLYVDQARAVAALGERLASKSVKRGANHTP